MERIVICYTNDLNEEKETYTENEGNIYATVFHLGQQVKVTRILKETYQLVQSQNISEQYSKDINQWGDKFIRVLGKDYQIRYFKSESAALDYFASHGKLITKYKVSHISENYQYFYYYFDEAEATIQYNKFLELYHDCKHQIKIENILEPTL
jgi:hypothetical protein